VPASLLWLGVASLRQCGCSMPAVVRGRTSETGLASSGRCGAGCLLVRAAGSTGRLVAGVVGGDEARGWWGSLLEREGVVEEEGGECWELLE
jgi:hypothetical protein